MDSNINKTARISGQSPEFSDCPLIHVEEIFGGKIRKTINYGQYQRSTVVTYIGN